MKKKLIFTADDYGMCAPVDQAIETLIEAGILTSTNVLLNMDTPEHAKQLRNKYPELSIGLHWNVTTGKPLSPICNIPSLVTKQGFFHSINGFKYLSSIGKINSMELRRELTAQYETFLPLCNKPNYWNTHENSSLSFISYPVFRDTAKQCGIKSTRNFKRVYIDYNTISLKRKFREIIIRIVINFWFDSMISSDFTMPDGRLFPFVLSSKFDEKRLLHSIDNSEKQVIEIVLHPSTTSKHPLFGNISEDRVMEYDFFRNPNIIRIIKEHYDLCGYEIL